MNWKCTYSILDEESPDHEKHRHALDLLSELRASPLEADREMASEAESWLHNENFSIWSTLDKVEKALSWYIANRDSGELSPADET